MRPALLMASLFVGTLSLIAGCGGGDSDPNPSPSPTSSPLEGRGALADGCGGSGTQLAQPGWTVGCGAPVQPKRKWTVLLYMNGANDLEEFGTLNLNQLEQYGSDANVTFVAQFKRIHSTDSSDDTSDGDWDGARRIVVRADNNSTHVSSPVVSTRADIDMGNPTTLQEFVQWGVKTFPADHYAIVLWNHGAGWRSRAAGSAKTRGFSYDDEKGTHIDTIEIPAAIDIGNGQKWDLVAWDSSLMQMLEVGYEIRNKANWIVGGEESPPGTGYPYQTWSKPLVENPDISAPNLGRAISDAMLSGYTANSNITQSVLDTSKIEAIAPAMNDFGAALMAAKTSFGTLIAEDRDNSEYYDYRNNKDLLDFIDLIKSNVTDANVVSAANRAESAVRAAIVYNVHGNVHPNSNGLAVYIPTPNGYKRDDIEQANGFGQRYSELSFAKAAPNWQSFLADGPP